MLTVEGKVHWQPSVLKHISCTSDAAVLREITLRTFLSLC